MALGFLSHVLSFIDEHWRLSDRMKQNRDSRSLVYGFWSWSKQFHMDMEFSEFFLFNCRRTTLNKNDISPFEANVFLYAIVDVDV